ncbi:hypothetical protein C7S13_2368 [Burkholderia cepacia]|nr:hypothetical protein [Burkholderia cepacia]
MRRCVDFCNLPGQAIQKITYKNHKDKVGCGNRCSAALQKIINRLMLVNPIAFERHQAFP